MLSEMIIVSGMVAETPAGATGRALLDELPPPLPAERIVSLNSPKGDLHTHRTATWNGWAFDVPPGVFLPGATSRMVYDRVLDGRIEVRGRRYLAMGCGIGAEVVAAAARGAVCAYAADVHEPSVRVALEHVRRFAPETATEVVPAVGDLLDGLPAGAVVDVVTFNPPAVSRPVSDDPDVVRNVCAGSELLRRFFVGIAERGVLAPAGEIYVIASTTADLRAVAGHGLDAGFTVEVAHHHDWQDGVLTYLLRFTPEQPR
jgi:release factor glutamine methyltransferase